MRVPDLTSLAGLILNALVAVPDQAVCTDTLESVWVVVPVSRTLLVSGTLDSVPDLIIGAGTCLESWVPGLPGGAGDARVSIPELAREAAAGLPGLAECAAEPVP